MPKSLNWGWSWLVPRLVGGARTRDRCKRAIRDFKAEVWEGQLTAGDLGSASLRLTQGLARVKIVEVLELLNSMSQPSADLLSLAALQFGARV